MELLVADDFATVNESGVSDYAFWNGSDVGDDFYHFIHDDGVSSLWR